MQEIAKAIVAVQSKLHNVQKNAEGYGYNYLTLDKLVDETRSVLAEHGLAVLQPLDHVGDEPAVRTILIHTSGESVEGSYPIGKAGMKGVNEAQQMGAAVSYARRYGLAAMLNIAQVDNDAAGTPQPQQQQQAGGNW